MWEYLSKLHPLLPYSLIIIAMIATVIISLKGKLMVKWGKNVIGLGSSAYSEKINKNSKKKSDSSLISCRDKKRSCIDCLKIIDNEREKCCINKKTSSDKILTYLMNYTEEKLLELEISISSMFESMIAKIPEDKEHSIEIESKMFYGLLKEAIYQKVKTEIRRSCKENGFCELSETEFSIFVNDKSKIDLAILTRYLRSIYPLYGTLVPIDDVIQGIESKYEDFKVDIREIYTYAKQVIADSNKELKRIEDSYQEWASNFVK